MVTREYNSLYRIGADPQGVLQALQSMQLVSDQTFQRMTRAAEPANRAMEQLDRNVNDLKTQLRSAAGTIAVLDGPLGGIASRINALATVIGRIGFAGASMAAGLTAGIFAVSKSIAIQSQMEQSSLRLTAVLRATGNAAGLTAMQIEEMSQQLGLATLTSANAARDAAQVLLTFRSVQGETFRQAMSLSQDLAATYGQSLQQSVTQIGKALEDPLQGLSSLRRVGVTFSTSERERIREMVEMNRVLDAQRLILEGLRRQVGGAGEGEAGGVAGAYDSLVHETRRLGEAFAQSAGLADVWTDALKATTEQVTSLRQALQPEGFAAQIEAVDDEIARLQSRVGTPQPSPSGDPLGDPRVDRFERDRARLRELLADRKELIRLLEEEIELQNDATMAAQGANIEAALIAEEERAAAIRGVIDALQAEVDLLGESNVAKEMAAALSKDLAKATREERIEYRQLLGEREAIQRAEKAATSRADVMQELRNELVLLGATAAQRRIYLQLMGDFQNASAEEQKAMMETINAIEAQKEATEKLEDERKEQERRTRVIEDLELEVDARNAVTEAMKREITARAALGDDATGEDLERLSRALASLAAIDQREKAVENQQARDEQFAATQRYIDSLGQELNFLEKSNTERRLALALQNELRNATPEQVAEASGLIRGIGAGEKRIAGQDERQRARETARETIADLELQIRTLSMSAEQAALTRMIEGSGLAAADPLLERIKELNAELFRLQNIAASAPVPRDKGEALEIIARDTIAEQNAAMSSQAEATKALIDQLRPASAAAEEFQGKVALLNSTIGQDMLRAAGIDHAEAMRMIRAEYAQTSEYIVGVMRNASASIAASIADMVRGARFSLAELATSMAAFAVQSGIQRSLDFGIDQLLGSFGPQPATAQPGPPQPLVGALNRHAGGMVDDSGPFRPMPAALFHGAPRYHNGLYLAPDERPVILQTGEQVIPRGGGRSEAMTINLRVDGEQSDAVDIQESERNAAGRQFNMIVKQSVMQTMGSPEFGTQMARLFGVRRRSR
jgi:hypothetical protein